MSRFTFITALFLAVGFVGCFPAKPIKDRADLVVAIGNGDLPKVKRLVEKGCDFNSPDTTGFHLTPLMWAISCRQREVLAYLLQKGANPNAKNSDGETALHVAIYGRDRNADVVALLISHGADVNAKDRRGCSVLTCAKADPPAPQLVDILLKAGAHD
jgi:ankyrin repeat protein